MRTAPKAKAPAPIRRFRGAAKPKTPYLANLSAEIPLESRLGAVDKAQAFWYRTRSLAVRRPAGRRTTPLAARGGFVLVQIFVRENNVDQALKALKKKMQREGTFREMKRRSYFEKPSEKRAREAAEAVRRTRKLARKRAQREGLIAGPVRKPRTP